MAINTAQAEAILGHVVDVSDGDTITLLAAGNEQIRVRLTGIDAPEKLQSYGQVSKRNLSDLVFDRDVQVETTKKDRYGRTLGKVLVASKDANLEQVRAGLAWHYKQYAREQLPNDQAEYAEAEEQARAARKGLWRDPDPVPPWEFRRR